MKIIGYLVLAVLLISSSSLTAQVKPGNQNSDTINKFDSKNARTGFWEEKQGDVVSKGIYVSNKKVNNWISYYPNGLISKLEFFSNGVRDGISLQFDRKGKVLVQEYYRNGLLHGPSITYNAFNENPVIEIHYENGKKTGLYRQFYDNNKIMEDCYYKDDLKTGIARWFNRTGKMVAEYNYKNGLFDGLKKHYYDNDTVETSATYVEDKLSGEYKEFYRNGKLKIAGTYVNNVKEGTWTEYDELGKSVKILKCKNDICK